MDKARRAAGTALAAALLAGTSACGLSVWGSGNVVERLAATDTVAVNLVLIGDAGLPNPAGEPVLAALKREIEQLPDRTFVVFLGDNVYPAGLPDTATLEGREGLRILRAQMAPLLETGVRGVFVPGNHDWAQGAAEGWNEIVRQERFVNENGRGIVTFEPRFGCPGPVVIDVGEALRVIAFDSQWWLHAGPRPSPDQCTPGTERAVLDSMRSAIRTAGDRRTVVVSHHPLVSGGRHGGYFDWPTYLFPLHPWARLAGLFARQDVSGREYRHMIESMEGVFATDTPMVYAGGHEHNLQVFRRGPMRYMLISGGGIYGHTTPTRRITGTQYVREASGFQRLTILADGRTRLGIVVVDAQGNAHEDYSVWLDVPPIRRPDMTPPARVPVTPSPAASPAPAATGPR